jgi:hypothetical protein
MDRAYRARRSCLAVPASSELFISKASRKMAEVIVARGNAAGYAEIPKATE